MNYTKTGLLSRTTSKCQALFWSVQLLQGGVQGLVRNVVVCGERKSGFSAGDKSTFCISIALTKILYNLLFGMVIC